MVWLPFLASCTLCGWCTNYTLVGGALEAYMYGSRFVHVYVCVYQYEELLQNGKEL